LIVNEFYEHQTIMMYVYEDMRKISGTIKRDFVSELSFYWSCLVQFRLTNVSLWSLLYIVLISI